MRKQRTGLPSMLKSDKRDDGPQERSQHRNYCTSHEKIILRKWINTVMPGKMGFCLS